MVRIFEVKQLEEKRRLLVARSEIHRRMLELEATNLKVSVCLLKERFSVVKIVRNAFGIAAPLAGALFAQPQNNSSKGGGLLSRLLSGLNLALGVLPLFRKSEPPAHPKEPAAP